MSTVLERMRARLLRDGPTGTPCRACGTDALSCQIAFVETGERDHCCPPCRTNGARFNHRTPEED